VPCFAFAFAFAACACVTLGAGAFLILLPAFWALVILLRLFSYAIAFAKLIVTSFPPFFLGAGRIDPLKISAVD
jgi:multisubunit Na+/H+ antiporter MnhC subunit